MTISHFALALAATVFGGIITLIVSTIFRQPLSDFLAPLVARLGSKPEDGFTGLWVATHEYPVDSGKIRIDVIRISNFFGRLVGRIEPHELNNSAAKRTEAQRPVRVRGQFKDSLFTGEWLHPERSSHHLGAYQLWINLHRDQMLGKWTCCIQSTNTIATGTWVWVRLDKYIRENPKLLKP